MFGFFFLSILNTRARDDDTFTFFNANFVYIQHFY